MFLKNSTFNNVKSLLIVMSYLLFISIHLSCKKEIKEETSLLNSSETLSVERNPDANCDLSTNICEDCLFQEQTGEDEDDVRPTVLGSIYNNPYSIANMTAAYNYIYSANLSAIAPTHKYVRFKPNSVSQLGILDSLDIELYDHPLNRHVIQDGDYWPEAGYGLSQGEYPWFYTVVDLWFNFPPGIQMEILEEVHIPDVNVDLENEAFYISGNSTCDSVIYANKREEIKEYHTTVPNEYIPCALQRPTQNTQGRCGGGGGGGGGGTQPTPRPAGMLNFKTYTTSLGGRSGEMMTEGIGASAPLKYTKVVGRRFLKIDKTYTDQNGNFQFSKRFPNKVTLIVKFKASTGHGQHSVRTNNTGAGFWRSMFPMKKNIGTYKGNNLQNLNYQFEKGSTSIQRKTRDWIAAIMMNTTEEGRSLFSENGMIQPANDLRLYLYSPGEQIETPSFEFLRRSNAPYTNQDRVLFDDIMSFVFASVPAALTVTIAVGSGFSPGGIALSAGTAMITFAIIPHKPDVYFHYKTSDINSLTATKVSISMGQQLGILYLYQLSDLNNNIPGASRFTYLSARNYALQTQPYSTYAPFGNNIPASNYYYNYKPEVIAIYESFAQHFGHAIANRMYGNGAQNFELQGKQWVSDASKSSNLKYLEEFDPNIGVPNDYFNWIPVGLINDLMDNTPDLFPSQVIDNVSGFTYQEIQSVLMQKPSLLSQVKSLLKDIRPSQSIEIDQLFASYGY